MHLSVDNTNLGMLLPMRAGLGLSEYQQLIINEFSESIFDDVDAHLCQSTGMDAVLFSTDTADDGKLFAFKGCDQAAWYFPQNLGRSIDVYQKTLVFIESESYVYTFFADLKYVFSGFSVGEMMLAEFEIPDCGTCETVVTVVRTEHHPGRGFHTLVAIKMALTTDKKRRPSISNLCKNGEEIKKLSDPSRSIHGHPFVRKF